MSGKYLTTFEASRLLGVSLPTVVNWIKASRIKAHRTPGGHRRIAREDLLAFVRRYRMPVPSELAGEPDARRRVLAVDDDADERELIRASLETAGYEVHLAENGFEAGVLVRGIRPDAVILDLMMPGVDGFAALEVLRRHPETAELPVIAATGLGDEATRRRTLAAGFAAHLVKPYPRDELLGTLERLLTAVRLPAAQR